jgi:hypothetical protein
MKGVEWCVHMEGMSSLDIYCHQVAALVSAHVIHTPGKSRLSFISVLYINLILSLL